jgi:hypothetical protein
LQALGGGQNSGEDRALQTALRPGYILYRPPGGSGGRKTGENPSRNVAESAQTTCSVKNKLADTPSHCIGSGLIESESGSRVLMTKICEKFRAGKNLIFFISSKIAIYLYLCLLKGCPLSKQQEKPSKENIHYFKNEISELFLKFLLVICPLGCEYGFESVSGFTDLIESGSNPEPDPKHCYARITRFDFNR